jgi:hypothetical protein
MPMKGRATRGAWVGALLLPATVLLGTIGSAHAAPFDGTWSVLQVCETTSEGARGYTWRYDAEVKNGHFVGQYRTKGQSPSMTLEGQIQPDGTANLQAQGISGDAEHNVKFAQAQTPISFRVAAKFEGSKGNGTRLGSRACKFTFSKQ